MSHIEALAEIPKINRHQDRRAEVGEALEELVAA